MRTLICRGASLFLLGICLAGPVLSAVDPWDPYPDTGDHLILLIGAVSGCVGAACFLALVLSRVLSRTGPGAFLRVQHCFEQTCRLVAPPRIPLELLQPLRI